MFMCFLGHADKFEVSGCKENVPTSCTLLMYRALYHHHPPPPPNQQKKKKDTENCKKQNKHRKSLRPPQRQRQDYPRASKRSQGFPLPHFENLPHVLIPRLSGLDPLIEDNFPKKCETRCRHHLQGSFREGWG